MPYADKNSLDRLGIAGQPNLELPFHYKGPIALHGTYCFANVKIGRHSYMNSGTIRSDVSIGRYCSMGRNISIAAGDHPLEALTTHPVAFQCRTKPHRPENSARTTKHRTTEIGHDVWIGDNVVILSGIKIGTGAVIGANAVVTKDVKDYEIVGGVPARHIRMRFSDGIIESLLSSEWWTLKKETVQKLEINDIVECLRQIPILRDAEGSDDWSFQTITS